MFSTLIGNDEVKETLRRLLSNGRLPGSLLFTGEAGIGKKLFALELAKTLNCRNRHGVEACDECSSCKRIARSTFPPFGDDDEDKARLVWSEHTDVAMVRPYKQIIRVGPIRELEREANFRPFEGAARIFIVEDAEYMNDQAANAPDDVSREYFRRKAELEHRDLVAHGTRNIVLSVSGAAKRPSP